MKTLMIGLPLCFALAALSGCSSSSDSTSNNGNGADGSPLSCNNPVEGICYLYGAIPDDERGNDYCTLQDETEVSSCATSNVYASCAYSNYTGNSMFYWYNGTADSDSDIKAMCDRSSGTLTMN